MTAVEMIPAKYTILAFRLPSPGRQAQNMGTHSTQAKMAHPHGGDVKASKSPLSTAAPNRIFTESFIFVLRPRGYSVGSLGADGASSSSAGAGSLLGSSA